MEFSGGAGGWRDNWDRRLRARKRVLPVNPRLLGEGVKGEGDEGGVAGMESGTHERGRGGRTRLGGGEMRYFMRASGEWAVENAGTFPPR